MKKIDLGQNIGVLANLGVLVGILLLVYELNQNRQMMEAQTRHELAQSIVEQLEEVASNPDLASIQYRGFCGGLESGVDRSRFFSLLNSRFRYWEDVHYQYQQGLFGETEFVTQKETWRNYLSSSAAQDAWNRMRRAFSTEFVAEIDALLMDSSDPLFAGGVCD